MERTICQSTLFAIPLALGLAFAGMPGKVEAQVALGIQGNWASEAELGVGARVLANVGGSNFEVVGSGDVFFPDSDIDWLDINANLFYHFHLPDSPSVMPYVGGGVNFARISGNGSTTETGMNLGGGIRFPSQVTPFIEFRAVIGGAEQFVVTGGLLWGPTRFR